MLTSNNLDFATFLNNAPHITRTRGIAVAKELLGENIPYIKERRFTGDVIIFNDHFIKGFIEAISINCTAKLDSVETDLLFKYVRYQDCIDKEVDTGLTYEEELVCKYIDKWIIDEIACEPHYHINECYNNDYSIIECNSGNLII